MIFFHSPLQCYTYHNNTTYLTLVKMPRKTKAEHEAELASVMEALFASSALAEDDSDVDMDSDSEDDLDDLDTENDAAEALFLAGVESMQNVIMLCGDGTRGPYSKIPKSKDWFSSCLQAPDRDFWWTFRFVIIFLYIQFVTAI